MAQRVLVVDDEKLIVKGIRFSLEQDGMKVDCAYDGEEALKLAEENAYDMILLDVMLPKMTGFEVCQQIRGFSNVPIVMLTAKGDDMDKILGLDYGADDYITKPFSPSELVARVDAMYRRISSYEQSSDGKILKAGPFALDIQSRSVKKNGTPIELTQIEYGLLEYFIQNSGIALDRNTILRKVWHDEFFSDDKIVDVNVRRLRMKIEDDPSSPAFIQTVWGYGYKWTI